jgi:predicted TIM-barrel fold metal-dependent hydrolase
MDEWVQSEALLRGRPPTVRFIAPPPVEDLFCPLISVDDHVLEPPTLFDGRLPRRLAERAPAVAGGPGGLPMWVIDDRPWPVTMANGAAGRERTDWGFYCISFEETRPGVTDPTARLADIKFSTMKDPAVGLACLKAYNDWMIEEWCAAAPDRYIPCQLPWLPDPLAAAEEIRRNATRGFRAVSFSENPEGLGFPNIYSSHWEPFLAACEETGTVVNLHVGSSGTTRQPSTSSPSDVSVALFPVSALEALIDWIYAAVPVKFPRLRVALSEGGVSWVPMAIERLRRAYTHDVGRSWPTGAPAPEELIRRNFAFCSIEDPSAFKALDIIGEDNVMVETDYPHFDSTWPQCQEMVRGELRMLPPTLIGKVTYQNAARIYRTPEPPTDWINRSEIGRQLMNTAGPHP